MSEINWQKEIVDQGAHIGVGAVVGGLFMLLGLPAFWAIIMTGIVAFTREASQREWDFVRTGQSKKAWFETTMFQLGAFLVSLFV